jgi:FkbH-like protein
VPTESAADPDHRDASIIVAATFTADPLVDSLGLFMRETGLDLPVELAPYDQVFQELLDRTRPFSRNRNGVNVVLVRFDDWLRDGADDLDRREVRAQAEKLVADLVVALREAAQALPTPIVLCVGPSALAAGARPTVRTFLKALERTLLEGVAGLPTIHLLSEDRLRPLEPGATYDTESDHLARLPYTPIFFAHLGTALARLIHALKSPPRKVLALDCDNTLWRGGVGEERVAGIAITPPYRALQGFALAKKRAGMVLCLASKNVEADVTEVFRERDDMVLRDSDLAATRVNWLPKSENLKSLAAELNLGLDSFVFVDDNPVECAEVEASCPGLLVLRLPVEGDFSTFLENVWPLDQLRVTEEDHRRTESYRQNRERLRHQRSATSFAQFLAGLELRIDIAPARPEHQARAAQLTQRTNQFNFTTRRRTEGEIAQLAAEGLECRVVEVADRFGDYGLVGLLIFGVTGSSLVIDTMLLSCRALGRGVEHAMLRELGAAARARGLTQVEAPFIPTKKNLPARLFLDGLETPTRLDQAPGTRYVLAADSAAQIIYAPNELPAAGPDAPPGAGPTDGAHNDNAARAAGGPSGETPSARWNRIARELDTPAKVLAVLAGARRRGRGLKEAAATPRNELERTLCRIWAEELGLSEVGIHDDYFELGGTSLAAVSIFARLEREIGPRIPLATLMEAKTVAALAARLAHGDEIGSLVALSEEGSGIPLFLVHDADGETLLYRNLARRLPGRPVYGIQPCGGDGFPIRHTRIEEMVAHYLSEIRKVRPHGPYLLGGLCAGGVLAFEMARQLELAHEEARLVAIFDAAAVEARVKPHLATRRRLERVRAAIGAHPLTHIPHVVVSKVRGYLRHQIGQTVRRAYDRVSIVALRRTLERGGSAPDWLKNVSVRTVYTNAEAEYRTDHVLREEIVLFRATAGVGHEEPYIQIYEDPLLGWGPRSAKGVTAIDVPGGHGSLLQEPHVAAVADVLAPLLAEADRALAEQRSAAVG